MSKCPENGILLLVLTNNDAFVKKYMLEFLNIAVFRISWYSSFPRGLHFILLSVLSYYNILSFMFVKIYQMPSLHVFIGSDQNLIFWIHNICQNPKMSSLHIVIGSHQLPLHRLFSASSVHCGRLSKTEQPFWLLYSSWDVKQPINGCANWKSTSNINKFFFDSACQSCP